ncbi:DUF4328 domain-containing protein [Geoalkalibacter halelectricus]|uniref:DUF4328 domain-containing protein n=1 Tax=Geoalkalibacter halelectricus TaxID=2847045 RepID=UPI003D214535
MLGIFACGAATAASFKAADCIRYRQLLHAEDAQSARLLWVSLEKSAAHQQPILLLQTLLAALVLVLFFKWVALSAYRTKQFAPQAFSWTPRRAVWGFLLPLLNAYQPYLVLRDLLRTALGKNFNLFHHILLGIWSLFWIMALIGLIAIFHQSSTIATLSQLGARSFASALAYFAMMGTALLTAALVKRISSAQTQSNQHGNRSAR